MLERYIQNYGSHSFGVTELKIIVNLKIAPLRLSASHKDLCYV